MTAQLENKMAGDKNSDMKKSKLDSDKMAQKASGEHDKHVEKKTKGEKKQADDRLPAGKGNGKSEIPKLPTLAGPQPSTSSNATETQASVASLPRIPRRLGTPPHIKWLQQRSPLGMRRALSMPMGDWGYMPGMSYDGTMDMEMHGYEEDYDIGYGFLESTRGEGDSFDFINDTEDDVEMDETQDDEVQIVDETGGADATEGPEEEEGQDLLADYRERYADEDGDPVSEKLAGVVNAIWQKGKDSNTMKSCYVKYPRPGNLDLHKVDLNEEIISSVNNFARARDLRLRAVQAALTRAAVPTTRIVQGLIDPKSSKLSKQAEVDMAIDSVTMLSNANGLLNQVRRDMLKPLLNKKFQILCNRQTEGQSQFLLGDNLHERIKVAAQGGRLGKMRGFPMQGARRRYQPYGYYQGGSQGGYQTGGRGRGFTPYGQRQGFLGKAYTTVGCKDNIDLVNENVAEVAEQVVVHAPDNMVNDKNNYVDMIEDEEWSDYEQGDDMMMPVCRSERSGARPRTVQGDGPERQEVKGPQDAPSEEDAQVGEYLGQINLNRWDSFEAGRISRSATIWCKLTSDYILLRDIRGLKLDFTETPQQGRPEQEIRFTDREREFLRREIENLLAKKVIQKVEHVDGEYISNVFLREKKGKDRFRMILNLKKLNMYIEKIHFKMDTLQTALALVHKDCWFLSFDFTDAYYSVAVAPGSRKYLRFCFEGQLYEFTCLANGLRPGPRLFTKLLKVPLSFLREKYGITITAYLDDTLLVFESEADAYKYGEIAAELLQDLGFMISKDKSVVTPTKQIEFLGFVIDSRTMQVMMTDDKSQKILGFVKQLMGKKTCSIRFLAKVIGKVLATAPANQMAARYTKQLEIEKNMGLANNKFDYDAVVEISDRARRDLVWWSGNIGTLTAPVIVGKPDYELYTDASTQGWGCYDPQTEKSCGGRWTEEEGQGHINCQELMAVLLGLKSMCKEMKNRHIRLRCDNVTAVAAVRKQGSIKSFWCNSIAKKIWHFAMDRHIWLSIAHCKGVWNVEADAASREFKDETEWTLDKEIFGKVCEQLGVPDIDLFASRLNYRVNTYCSWHPDPEATYVDSFLYDWGGRQNVYAFPPFAVLPAVMQKWRFDRAEGIAIVPFWPTKPWFTQMCNMLMSEPLVIPLTENVLSVCSSRGERKTRHPLMGRLTLLACHLSGDDSRWKDWGTELLAQWPRPDGIRPKNCTYVIGECGRTIVCRGRLVRLGQVLVKD